MVAFTGVIGDEVVITNNEHTTFFVTSIESISAKTGKIKVKDSYDKFYPDGTLITTDIWTTSHLEKMTEGIRELISHQKLVRIFKYKDWDNVSVGVLKALFKTYKEEMVLEKGTKNNEQ